MKNRAKNASFFKKLLASDPLRASDVGSDGGICEHWVPYLDLLRVDAFEPNEAECKKQALISPPHIDWHPIGLAKTSGAHTLYVPKRTTGASLYPPNLDFQKKFGDSTYWGEIRQVSIECLAYQDFLQRYKKSAPNIIKIDTQGSELDILSSFTDEQLQEVIAVEVEVEFQEIYLGQPLFFDVHQFMLSKGFELLDLRTARAYHSKDNFENYYLKKHMKTARATPAQGAQLLAGDALYFRKFSDRDSFHSKTFLTKAILSAAIYHFFDLALWLVDRDHTH